MKTIDRAKDEFHPYAKINIGVGVKISRIKAKFI